MAKVKIPKASWWKEHGMPLKQIPMARRDLKDLDDESKNIAAMATWPTVIKVLIITAIMYAAFAIFYFAFQFSAGDNFSTALQNLIIIIIVALFLAPKPAALLDGFETIKGYDRLGINSLVAFLIMLFTFPMRIVGAFANSILILINRASQSKMLGMPRICLPQNCDYDDFIDYYSNYEKQSVAQANFEMYTSDYESIANHKASDLKDEIYDLEHNSDMDYMEKQRLLDEKRKTLDAYEETINILKEGVDSPEARDRLSSVLNDVSGFDGDSARDLRDMASSLKDDYAQYEKAKDEIEKNKKKK